MHIFYMFTCLYKIYRIKTLSKRIGMILEHVCILHILYFTNFCAVDKIFIIQKIFDEYNISFIVNYRNV